MKVRELANWPPKPGNANGGPDILPSPEEATIYKVIYCRREWITFICEFGDEIFIYDFRGTDDTTCEALKRVLEGNIGMSLASIAEVELGV